MPNPTKPTIDYSYTGFQQEQQDFPFPGHELDNDLANLVNSIDQTIDALKDIRRADGALKNGIVTNDSLSSDLLIGIEAPTDWTTATAYNINNTVYHGDAIYRAKVSHLSGDFATDLANGKWELIVDFSSLTDAAAESAAEAAISASEAGNSAASAAGSASAAGTSATNAANSAADAATAETAAEAAQAAAEAVLAGAGTTGLALLADETADDGLNTLGFGAGGKTIAVQTSLQAVRDVLDVEQAINPKHFGAVGDGVVDDTLAINSALSAAATAGVSSVYIPSGAYRVTGLSVAATGMTIFGDGASSVLKLADAADSHVLDLGTSSDVLVTRLKIDGNYANQTTVGAYDTAGIATDPGASNIRIIGNDIVNSRGCGILLSGVDTAMVRDNVIDQTWIYAGVECSGQAQSTNVSVIGNHISRTQTANVQATAGIVGWVVSNNLLDGTDVGLGDPVSDNITGYAQVGETYSDILITNNVMKNSGNHGLHIGGDRIVVTNNLILNPLHSGIYLGKGPNESPQDSIGFTVTGNLIQKNNRALPTAMGIQVTTTLDGTISGNRIAGCHYGISIWASASSALKSQNITIAANAMRDIENWHIRIRGGCSHFNVNGNVIHAGGVTVGGGIWLDNTLAANGNIAVTHNYLRNLPVGIREDSGHTFCDISDNTFSNCTVPLTIGGTYTAADRGSRDRALATGVRVIASASNIAKPTWLDGYVSITGTTNINTINIGPAGQIITLRFGGVLTVVDSAGLRLAGDFVTAASATLTLISDGLQWYELSRSTN